MAELRDHGFTDSAVASGTAKGSSGLRLQEPGGLCARVLLVNLLKCERLSGLRTSHVF